MKILVVDDENDLRELIADLLRGEGFDVTEADSGASAIAAADAETPHAVLLDLGLPDGDGWSVLDHLRAEPATSAVPVLIVSANDSPAETARAAAAGFTRFRPKPFLVEDVLDDLMTLLPARPRDAPHGTPVPTTPDER